MRRFDTKMRRTESTEVNERYPSTFPYPPVTQIPIANPPSTVSTAPVT
jgi:hypothetical protein